jgi:hypothetical protein
MPSWVKDDEKWAKAKEIAAKEYGSESDDDEFWKLVTGIYKKMMGGNLAKAVPVLFVKADYAERYSKLLARRTDGSPEAMAQEDEAISRKAKISHIVQSYLGWPGWVKNSAIHALGTYGIRLKNGDSLSEALDKLDDDSLNTFYEDCDDNGDLIPLTKAQPTEAQIEAGNYPKKKVAYRGLRISIENPKGSTRSGTDPNGHKWSITMKNDYGYIRGTLGVAPDKDHLDCYLGPDENAENVYIVHQRKAGNWKDWDEDKCLLAFPDKESAIAAYLKHYDDPRFLGPVTTMPFDEFKEKALNHKGKPTMIKAVPILFLKAHIPAHTRRLPNGRVIQVRAYDNSRRKQPQRDDRTMDMFGEHPEPMPEKSPAQADLGASGGDLFGGESETKQEPHEQLSAMLKRGDLNGAVNVLRAMTYEGAHEAILRAGFAVGSIKRKTAADVVAAVQGQLVQAAKRKTDGFGLRESKRPDTITEPRSEMVKEHKRLVRVLESPSHADDEAEAKRQRAELEEYEGKSPPRVKSVKEAKPEKQIKVYRDPEGTAINPGAKPSEEDQANPRRKYYVTMIREGRGTAFLAGPFDRHADTEAMVTAAREKAVQIDPHAVWDAFGTSGVVSDNHKPGKLNDLLGLPTVTGKPLTKSHPILFI